MLILDTWLFLCLHGFLQEFNLSDFGHSLLLFSQKHITYDIIKRFKFNMSFL